MAYEKRTWVSGTTPCSSENFNHIEQGIADAHDKLDELNTKIGTGLNNTDTSGITSYPKKTGCYRVINGNIKGLPKSNAAYGTLLISNGGSYVLNLYIDSKNTMYWCRTDGFVTPTGWKTATTIDVSANS